MKIAYIVSGNPYDKHSWSGTNYYVRLSLEKQGHQVYCIYGFKPRITIRILIKKIIAKIFHKRYISYRNVESMRQWAKYISSHLEDGTDAIFSLGTIQVGCLETNIPIYIYVDGIFEQMRKFYKWGNLSKLCIKDANKAEQIALNKCSKIISCSQETGDKILEYYNISANKLEIVPLGANLDEIPSREVVYGSIEKRSLDECHLLFVGVDWQRKGADIVLDTVKELHNRGLKVILHLCGLKNIPVPLPPYVINHGFLRKNNNKEYNELISLYKTSHFLFVPSNAEAYGLVFCEASAFGLPSISHRIGGLMTVVKDGVNGQLFEKGMPICFFADYIENIFKYREKYVELAKNTRQRFESLLNWEVAGKKLTEIMYNEIN